MGDREILETHLNSASKNTSETDIFPHGTKSLLTSVIYLRARDICLPLRMPGQTSVTGKEAGILQSCGRNRPRLKQARFEHQVI